MQDKKRVGRPRGDDVTPRQHANRRPSGNCQRCSAWSDCLHLDHITPIAEGGEHTLSNLQWLCDECDREKTSTDISRIMKAKDRSFDGKRQKLWWMSLTPEQRAEHLEKTKKGQQGKQMGRKPKS